MSLWETVPFVLLGVFVVLLPLGVIGVFASRLHPRERSGLMFVYGAALLLVVVVAADVMSVLGDKLAVDLVLLGGGVLVGAYGMTLLAPRLSALRQRYGQPSGSG